MTESFNHIRVEQVNRVATVTVNRPESDNSLNLQTLTELGDAINALQADNSVHVIVLTGAGKSFIAGADLNMFHEQSGTWYKGEFRPRFRRVERAIEDGPKPVLAAVSGSALGGGLELALTCDLIYATESAHLGVPESTLGGMPGAGGTQRLVHLLGYLKAKELVLTGRPISAETAADIGLVNDVFPDDEFSDRIEDIATDLADRAPRALWFAKEVINETRADMDGGLSLEAALGTVLFETDDLHEGFGAFLQDRDADFSDWDDLS